MPELIRSASLTSYAEVARSVGLDPLRMLSAAGIDRRCLGDPDLRMSAGALGRLLEMSAEQSGIEDFGLRLAQTRTLAVLGPVALLIREEPTVGAAIACLIRYMVLHNESIDLRLATVRDLAIISIEVKTRRPVAIRQGVELAVGVLYRIISGFLGRDQIGEVCFAHHAPSRGGCHRRVLGPTVRFGAEFNGVVLAARDLALPMPDADPTMRRYAGQYLDLIVARPGDSTLDKTRKLVALLLSSGRCKADLIAAQMGIDRRTLHRRLGQHGATFLEVVDAVRTQYATRLLQNRERPLHAVAESLGFSNLSGFSRWFRSKFGVTATAWRQR